MRVQLWEHNVDKSSFKRDCYLAHEQYHHQQECTWWYSAYVMHMMILCLHYDTLHALWQVGCTNRPTGEKAKDEAGKLYEACIESSAMTPIWHLSDTYLTSPLSEAWSSSSALDPLSPVRIAIAVISVAAILCDVSHLQSRSSRSLMSSVPVHII